jgi:hypothetical protein
MSYTCCSHLIEIGVCWSAPPEIFARILESLVLRVDDKRGFPAQSDNVVRLTEVVAAFIRRHCYCKALAELRVHSPLTSRRSYEKGLLNKLLKKTFSADCETSAGTCAPPRIGTLCTD